MLLDAKRVNKKRIKMIARPKGVKAAGKEDKEMSKKGGAINRAEFITALKEAQMYNKPLTEKGHALHALSTDAEYETYFNPMM
jgi:hypothetical protein